MANLCAKFEVSSFNPSRDMEEVPKFTHSLTDTQTDFIICPMLLMQWADNNKEIAYFDFASLPIGDNLVFFQFTEESIIDVYVAFHFVLLAFKDTLERCARHILNG